jgi:dihydroneopterin aldolase
MFKTVEALANFVAKKLLVDEHFAMVTVRVHKPSVFSNAEGPGVEITRSAPGFVLGQNLPNWGTELTF